jgi:hypothetical protein
MNEHWRVCIPKLNYGLASRFQIMDAYYGTMMEDAACLRNTPLRLWLRVRLLRHFQRLPFCPPVLLTRVLGEYIYQADLAGLYG